MTAHEELLPRDEEADAERLREENSRLWERLRAADPARARTLADQLGHESEEAAAREELLS